MRLIIQKQNKSNNKIYRTCRFVIKTNYLCDLNGIYKFARLEWGIP